MPRVLGSVAVTLVVVAVVVVMVAVAKEVVAVTVVVEEAAAAALHPPSNVCALPLLKCIVSQVQQRLSPARLCQAGVRHLTRW